MKKALFTALSLLLCVALLAMPMVVSASTAVEKTFEPIGTMWYSVDFVRTSAAKAIDDAYVYSWTPASDGVLTLEPDTDCKDAMVVAANKNNSSDSATLRYYPAGGYSSKDSVTFNVKAGTQYTVSVLTCSEKSATVKFFAYFTATSASGLLGSGTYSDPYIVDDKVKTLPAVDAGKTIYYLLTCDKTLTYNLKVRSADTADKFELYVENNKATATPAKGIATVNTITPFAASGYIMFSVTNKGTAKTATFTYLAEKATNTSTKGTYEDPATLVLNTNTTADISAVCYYYTYTATEDGTLSVKIENADNWVCSISGGAAESAYCTASDESVVNPVEYPVNAGDEISMWVATEAFGAGTVSFVATLKTVEETTVTEPQKVETTAQTEPVETTVASEPSEDVTTSATEPEETVTTAPADSTDATELVGTTSAANPAETTVTTEPVSSTAQTEPADTDVTTAPADNDNNTQLEEGFAEFNEDYCLSLTPLQLGANEIKVSGVAPATLFEFTPGEYAEYKFTASDANAIVGAYAGTVNYIPPTAEGTSNEAIVYFSSGQDIVVVVKGTASCTLTIEKIGEVEIKEELPWTIYENVVDVVDIETDVDVNKLTNVMIYDEIANKAVLGSDGYYHLDSENGEILYVDLNSYIMSFLDIVDRGKLCAVFYDENGNVTEKIDFTDAIFEYIENAAQLKNGEEIFYFYPLTADLIEMYQVVGNASDWYGRTGWVGGIADDAWMFGCYYEKGVTAGGSAPQTPGVTPGNPSAVPTGRNFLAAQIAVVAMLAAAAVVVFARKKTAE